VNTHEVILHYVAPSGDSRSRQLTAGSFHECRQFCANYNREHGKDTSTVEQMRESEALPFCAHAPYT
jgi:hypothetical protein